MIHEYDYGSPAQRCLKRHGDCIAVLSRNEPYQEWVARWRLLFPDSDVREPVPCCEECRPEASRYQMAMNSPRNCLAERSARIGSM